MSTGRNYAGASWWKLDVHTHTPASSDTHWAQQGVPFTPREWLCSWMDAGIDLVAVTDHNSGAWIDVLKAAYLEMEQERPECFRELVLFPGVEISVSSGFHLLALFDRAGTAADVTALLGAVRYMGSYGDTNGATEASAVDVVRAVERAGALAIPAHADEEKGLLRCSPGTAKAHLDANTLRQVFQSDSIVACEVVDSAAIKPEVYKESKCDWTEIVGSDWHGVPGRNEPGSRFTWVKMGVPSLEGLRLALLDGQRFSVRRSDPTAPHDPNALPEHFIEELSVADARCMGRGAPELLRFSPWMTALIGGRGTGKSTIVHALRLAYRRETGLLGSDGQGGEPARVFREFAQVAGGRKGLGGLTEGTELLATVSRDGVRHRLRWRQDASGVVVEEHGASGWEPSSSQSVSPERFPVRIYSQGQIAALALGTSALLHLIDEAAGTATAKVALEDATLAFRSLRSRARELDAKLARRDAAQVHLNDVRRKLQAFEAGDTATVLRRYQLALRQEREVERQLEATEGMTTEIFGLTLKLVPDDLMAGTFDGEGEATQAAVAALAKLREAIAAAEVGVGAAYAGLVEALDSVRQELNQGVWRGTVDQAKTAYHELVASLGAQSGADPSEFGALVQRRQALEKELAAFDTLAKERESTRAATATQLAAVRRARRELSAVRLAFIGGSLAGNAYVRIVLVPYGRDYSEVEASLRKALGIENVDRFAADILQLEGNVPTSGLVHNLLHELPQDPDARANLVHERLDAWQRRFEDAAQGGGSFGGHFRNYLKREIEKRPDFLDQLLLYAPEDELEVRFSQRGNGQDWRPIEQGSAGQQAAAMLAFLLAHGTEPIVLDQPEDDLDNHLIYNLVVHQLRENKLRRQVIVVTHNPNIVVNGDAEMLHAFDFRGGQCHVAQRGSLQEGHVREEVCRVMEGGREAFERRYQRLGRES